MFDEQPRNDSGSSTEGETGDKAGTGTVKDATNAGAPTGATIAATAKAPRRKAKRARKGPKLPLTLGLAKIVFALLTAATVLVAAWFAGFHLMVATVAPHAPVRPDVVATSQTPQPAPSPAMPSHGVSSPRASSALAASNPADYPATAGHVTLRDLALFAAPAGHPEMRNADTPTYRAYAAAKAYYDWYLEWYNVLAVGFLTSIAAYFVGEAVNTAVTTRLKDAPGKAPATGHPTSVAPEADTTAASTPSQGPDDALTVHNFLGILSISLGAIAALGVFIVNEHYRLLEPVHGDLPLRLLGAGPIAQDRWLTEPNVMRGLYDAAVGDAGRHAGYFPALYTALALTCLLPLMAGGSAIEAFRLTAALMGKVPGKAAQIVRDLLEGLKAQHARATADLEALNGRALSETEALRPLAAELQKCLADEADALRTQEVKIERLKRCRDFATTLSEYLEDLALKRRHLLDKRGDAHGPDARPAEPIDQNLESAVEALDLCLEQVKAAHLSVLREIARLEDELRAHALSLTACRERIGQLHPQVMALEARLAAIRTETERLEGRLGGLVEDIARQDEIVRDLSHPGSATNGVVVET